jgi:hypothetical protein
MVLTPSIPLVRGVLFLFFLFFLVPLLCGFLGVLGPEFTGVALSDCTTERAGSPLAEWKGVEGG